MPPGDPEQWAQAARHRQRKLMQDSVAYGRGKSAELRQTVHELLLDHEAAGELPTNGRFIFYELEA